MRIKINIFIISMVFVLSALCACGRQDAAPDFAGDGILVKLSATPKEIEEEPLTYTINIEVYNDGSLKIYADGFSKWYGDEEPKIAELNITRDEIDEIKQTILDEKLYNLHENVGNKDNISGIEKRLTIYTVEGTYSIYGISPSNVNFNRVYDLIYGLRRDELASYTSYVNDIQRRGSANDIGIFILDSNDRVVFDNSDIKRISTENIGTSSEYEDASEYKVAIELTDENIERLYEMTEYADDVNYITLNLYLDNAVYMLLYIDAPVSDGKVYSNNSYTKADAEKVADELISGIE